MEIYKIDNPPIRNILKDLSKNIDWLNGLAPYLEKADQPNYLFWDKVRFLPRPKERTALELWATVKLFRRVSPTRRQTIISDKNGEFFSWQYLTELESFLHEVDIGLGGLLKSDFIEDSNYRKTIIMNGILEEAIASSQLEGASTTRKVAKRMLLENREPANKSERMIINNYKAMLHIEEELKNEKLNMDKLLNLHRLIAEKTIEDGDLGRLRNDLDEIIVIDSSRDVIYHIPPPEKFLNKEIKNFIKYANDEVKDSKFIHPIIKAIILHFWIGYLHPFTDGNGRLARAIFYWYLLKNKYWGFSYLPLSRVIKKSPAQYRDAYIYSEQDDNDLTYFIDYNIRKIKQAKHEFERYINRKQKENKEVFSIVRSRYNLNNRQIQLIRFFYKDSEAVTYIKTHTQVYRVSRLTARKDLEKLESLGLLQSQKIGNERPFKATKKLFDLFS